MPAYMESPPWLAPRAAKYTIALFPRCGFSNRYLGLGTLAREKRMRVLESYGSLGDKESHAQGEEDDEGLHGHSKRGGVCGELLVSSSFFQSLPLENEDSIGKSKPFFSPWKVGE